MNSVKFLAAKALACFGGARARVSILTLALLLQKTPVFQYLARLDSALSSPVAHVARSLIAVTASLGAYHALSGATEFFTTPESPIESSVGDNFEMAFFVTGAPLPTASWVIQGAIPPGLSISSDSGELLEGTILNGNTGVISGIPTSGGEYVIFVTPYNEENGNGDTNGAQRIEISITENFPVFVAHPENATVRVGQRVQFFSTTNFSDPTFQWFKGEDAIAGANEASLIIDEAAFGDAGNYYVSATNTSGETFSGLATLTIDNTAQSRIVNISTRGRVGTGDDILVAGFVIAGSVNQDLLIRAGGPRLQDFGITEPLADPVLEIARGNPAVFFGMNDDWEDFPELNELVSTSQTVGAFPFNEGGADAALLANVVPDLYTASVSGANLGEGVSLVELYEVDKGNTDSVRIINISTRGRVGLDQNALIPGFVLKGEAAKTLLIRLVGPTLTPFGVQGALEDPTLQIVNAQQQVIFSNDDWIDASNVQEIIDVSAQVGAFALQSDRDAVALVSLPSSLAGTSYTVIASGVGGGTGVALVEVYEVD